MARQQVNFRASDLTLRQLDGLSKWWGTDRTESITVAVDRIYQQEAKVRENQSMTDLLNGKIQPLTNYPTTGRTWYYQNQDEPLTDIGRVPWKPGMHVLRRPNGSLVAIPGSSLRAENEAKWTNVFETLLDSFDDNT